MRPRILLDIDGVVCDFETPFLALINRHMGTDFNLSGVDGKRVWNLYDTFDVPQDIRELIDDQIHQPNYCLDLQPFSDSAQGVKMLQSVGDVYVCTTPWSSSNTWARERQQWIQRHFGIGKEKVISTPAKYVCSGDVLIDDRHENLEKWGRCNPHGMALRWVGPANRGQAYRGLSVYTWTEAIETIRRKTITGREWRTHD